MPKYMVKAKYTVEGTKGLLKDGGSGRKTAIEALAKNAGGKLEAMYYAFGEDDLFMVFDLPDNASAAALSLTVSASGAGNTTVIALLSIAEMDEAAKKNIAYKQPGK